MLVQNKLIVYYCDLRVLNRIRSDNNLAIGKLTLNDSDSRHFLKVRPEKWTCSLWLPADSRNGVPYYALEDWSCFKLKVLKLEYCNPNACFLSLFWVQVQSLGLIFVHDPTNRFNKRKTVRINSKIEIPVSLYPFDYHGYAANVSKINNWIDPHRN